MKIKRLASMLMLFSSLGLIYTGFFLFISPPGRIAHWEGWRLGGFVKEQYESLHITFVLVFLLSLIVHIFYNYRQILQYLSNKKKKFVVFTPETVLAIVVCAIFVSAGLAGKGPIHAFLEWGERVSFSWEKKYESAPYSQAELSSLKVFMARMGYDPDISIKALKGQGLKVESEDISLAELSGINNVTPEELYKILQKAHQEIDMSKETETAFPSPSPGETGVYTTGLGRVTLSTLCQRNDLNLDAALEKLREISPEVEPGMRVRDIAGLLGKTPEEILAVITQ